MKIPFSNIRFALGATPAAHATPAATPAPAGLRLVFWIVAGICLLTLSAKFKVPYYPVPITLQTLVLLLLPLAGGRAAIGAVLGYLALGAAGAPLFAGGGGMAYLTGPTGGFLLAFVPAAALLAALLRRRRGFLTLLAALAAADALVFAAGYTQLAIVLGDWHKAYLLGVQPFILGDASKVLLAAAVYSLVYRRQQRRQQQ